MKNLKRKALTPNYVNCYQMNKLKQEGVSDDKIFELKFE